jgi:hypothetical protein
VGRYHPEDNLIMILMPLIGQHFQQNYQVIDQLSGIFNIKITEFHNCSDIIFSNILSYYSHCRRYRNISIFRF